MAFLFPASWPWYHPLKLARLLVVALAAFAVLAYVGICAYLFCVQNQLEYIRTAIPTETAEHLAERNGLVPWIHPSPGAESPQGYVRPDFVDPAPRGTIVVFHGNAGTAYERTEYVAAFKRRGFRTFLYEYPGYGGRPGYPCEATIVPDARALIRSLAAASLGPIYVWGESLGSGVASAVCGDPTLPVQGLAILTPWDNIANVGLYRYPYIPVRQLMIDKYDSIANLQHFAHPICVIRSADDEVIPPDLTLDLIAHLPEPKKVIVHPDCGHDTWPKKPELPWWDDALNFIAPPK